MTGSRRIWLTDRYGAELDTSVTLDETSALLDTIAADDGDEEHRTISLTDEHGWNLEFAHDRVLFENVEGDEVGTAGLPDRGAALAIVAEFIDGDFDALRRRGWSRV